MDQPIGLQNELDEAVQCLQEGINAMELMTYGLASVKDPYAKGINAIYVYLQETTERIQKLLSGVN